MRIGWLRIDVLIPVAHSLKEKRRPLKSLVEKLKNRFNVSVAEVDLHDLHQRAVIGVAAVAPDGAELAGRLRAVREFIYNNPECQVVGIEEGGLGVSGK
ncbi:MAG: DUF503 domain-containing protein [Planctomycetota bacterium]|jgi:uncharacterized protein YlxP (DUF503 family)|nr:DUF503 domain-containing protein [Planctomycetota bacterium]